MARSEAGEEPPAPARARQPAGRDRGKRERLVTAARQVLYEQGVEKSALADVAEAADVPLGNVYYYLRPRTP